jgi:uncharacterized protein (TIGR00290 family)
MWHQPNIEIYYNVQVKNEVSSSQQFIACYHDKFFCSWSGGKDSSLALYRAIKAGGSPSCLFTMMIETGERSRSHGISKDVLEEQARCLDIPIRFCSASWQSYTERFLESLSFFKDLEIERGVFGDIDIESHRKWVENVCSTHKIIPWLPLWQEPRNTLLDELIGAGFRAEIVAVKEGVLSPSYLGKVLNSEILEEFKALGIDLCGEAGEYHTIVTDGPIFKRPLHIIHGKQVLKDGYWFSDVALHPDFH